MACSSCSALLAPSSLFTQVASNKDSALSSQFLGGQLALQQRHTSKKVPSISQRGVVAQAKQQVAESSNKNIILGGVGAVVLGLGVWLATPDAIGTVAAVDLIATSGNAVSGKVTFSEITSHFGQQYVKVEVELAGLAPGKHGFHVHEKGNVTCSDGLCTGGHYNPDGTSHGASTKPADMRHAGDLGNITADEAGIAKATFLDKVVQLEGDKSIVGRSVVIHAKEDDQVSQPVGNAGARVAYGTINKT